MNTEVTQDALPVTAPLPTNTIGREGDVNGEPGMDTTEISEPQPPGVSNFDRTLCTDEELNDAHRQEMAGFLNTLTPWTDPTKTDGYWQLTDRHREEWAARVVLRKKAAGKEKEAEPEVVEPEAADAT